MVQEEKYQPDVSVYLFLKRMQGYQPRERIPSREELHSQDLFNKRPDAGHQLIVKHFGFLVLIRLYGEPHERLGP